MLNVLWTLTSILMKAANAVAGGGKERGTSVGDSGKPLINKSGPAKTRVTVTTQNLFPVPVISHS